MKLVIKDNQKVWFTSDTHYSHSNICSATTKWKNSIDQVRNFSSLEEMNNTLVDNINACVNEDDILFHLGDWSFGGIEKIWEFRKQIKCKNIHLILGNHDHHIENKKLIDIGIIKGVQYIDVQHLFNSVHHYLELEIQRPPIKKGIALTRNKFVLMHYPIASWKDMNQGVIHLHGHVHLPPHQKLSEGKAMDVGCDGNLLCPYELQSILNIMKDQPIKKLSLPSTTNQRSTRGLTANVLFYAVLFSQGIQAMKARISGAQ